MALVADTAITNDTDFEKILSVQNIQALHRAGANWNDGHKEAVNSLITELSGTISPGDLTNQLIWREYCITWLAARIFEQHALDGGDEVSFAKAELLNNRLPKLFKKAYAAMLLDTDSSGGADTKLGRAIPQGMNLDSGGRYGNTDGRGVQHNRSMPGWTRANKDGGNTGDQNHGR